MSDNPILAPRAALLAQCPPEPPRLSEAEAAARPVHVTHWGTSGPAVLVIHGGVQGGLGGGPATFKKQAVLAQQGWQLDVVDRPGFGQSPSHGVDDMMADAPWIAALLGDGAHLIGHSWGGAEALLAAARRPDAVRSLVLVEPALQMLLMDDRSLIAGDPALQAAVGKFGGLLMAAKTPADYARGFARSLGPSAAGIDVPNAAAVALDADANAATSLGCSLLQARMAPPAVLKQAAETIAVAKIPVLVISGGWSPLFDAVGDLTSQLTGGTHIVVRSPNHFVQFESADDFNRTVGDFMRQAELRHAGK